MLHQYTGLGNQVEVLRRYVYDPVVLGAMLAYRYVIAMPIPCLRIPGQGERDSGANVKTIPG
jgi:hypothetical protein